MKLEFNIAAAVIGATMSVVVGVVIFHTPALGIVVTSACIGIMCGLIKWGQ